MWKTYLALSVSLCSNPGGSGWAGASVWASSGPHAADREVNEGKSEDKTGDEGTKTGGVQNNSA